MTVPPNSDQPIAHIHVNTEKHAYQVVIGTSLLAWLDLEIENWIGKQDRNRVKPNQIFLIADEAVTSYLPLEFETRLKRRNIGLSQISFAGGEACKNWEKVEDLCNWFLENKIERNDLILVLGGGTVGDLVGFAAGIIKRGVAYMQIPSTLLAMVDSSVGGKTAINSKFGKNQIGLFNPPMRVIADLDLLQSLPLRQLRAGLAEVLKYGLIGDPIFFAACKKNCAKLLAMDIEALSRAVRKSVEAKATIVMQDEYESGRRALLNLGHSFGHALEAIAKRNQGDLLHGEAVAVGMNMAARYSAHILKSEEMNEHAKQIGQTLAQFGLPQHMRDCAGGPFDPDQMLHYLTLDKKNQSGQITLILLKKIGEAFIENQVDRDNLLAFLREEAIR